MLGLGLVAALIGYFVVGKWVKQEICHTEEQGLITIRGFGPHALPRAMRWSAYAQWIVLGILYVLIIFMVLGLVVGIISGEIASYLSEDTPALLAYTFIGVWCVLFGVWLYLRIQVTQLLCPHCRHAIPTNLPWICPYTNCGHTNERIFSTIREILNTQPYALLGGYCNECRQAPAGFICTSCTQPMYFDSEKLRQKPELCARPVIPEGQVPEPVEEVVEEQKSEIIALVEQAANNLIDEEEAYRRAEELKTEAKKRLSSEAHKRFCETLDDQIRIATERVHRNLRKR